MIQYYDCNVHYNHRILDDVRKDILKRDYQSGVTKAINTATTMNSNFFMRYDLRDYVKKGALYMNKKDFCLPKPLGPEIAFCVGKNPLYIGADVLLSRIEQEKKEFFDLITAPDVRGVITGLDYFFGDENKEYQKNWFLFLLRLALEHHLPVALHVREADADALHILDQEFSDITLAGIVKSIPKELDFVKQYIDKGFFLSVDGQIFLNSLLRDAVEYLPLEFLVLESDFPYQAARLPSIAREIAKIKKCSPETVAEITYKNGEKLYG